MDSETFKTLVFVPILNTFLGFERMIWFYDNDRRERAEFSSFFSQETLGM
jgi:hypothetical protein